MTPLLHGRLENRLTTQYFLCSVSPTRGENKPMKRPTSHTKTHVGISELMHFQTELMNGVNEMPI